jgi:hypothetical protein
MSSRSRIKIHAKDNNEGSIDITIKAESDGDSPLEKQLAAQTAAFIGAVGGGAAAQAVAQNQTYLGSVDQKLNKQIDYENGKKLYLE